MKNRLYITNKVYITNKICIINNKQVSDIFIINKKSFAHKQTMIEI